MDNHNELSCAMKWEQILTKLIVITKEKIQGVQLDVCIPLS